MSLAYIIRYNEIGLKGKNRSFFEDTLIKNIKYNLRTIQDSVEIKKTRGRILLLGCLESSVEGLNSKLSKIAGIHSFSYGEVIERDKQVWNEKACLLFEKMWSGHDVKFRVSCTRSDKSYPEKSSDINAQIGAALIGKFGNEKLQVSLKDAQIDICLEINQDCCVIYSGSHQGLGGLPVSTAGRVLCLLSGGLDSPVAAFNMIRRGCDVHYIFFENKVFLGRAAFDKVERLAQKLSHYQNKVYLNVIPFTDIQVAIRDNCSPKNRVILYRRFMYRLAEKVCQKHQMQGLVTGENLGQVASQTLENLAAVDCVVNSVVYRPLISFDKLEIMETARNIDTYDISIEDAPDCCSVFMPKKPATRAVVTQLEKDESRLDVTQLEKDALENYECIPIEPNTI